jgi:hypothetical protein
MKLGTYAAVGAMAAALLLANSASAATVLPYSLVSGSFGTQLGVHSTTTETGVTTATGFVDQDGSAVTFTTTGTFNLDVNGQGEASVDGNLSNLTVNFAKAWGAVTFDLETQTQTPSTMTLLVNGVALFSDGVCGALCTLGNGSNKFILSGPNITSLAFTFSPDINDAKQFRLQLPGGQIPEPATWSMMIVGVGMIGAVMRKRRKMAWAPI